MYFTKKTRKCISHQPELVLFVIHLLSQSLRERRSKTRSRGSSRLCQLVLVDVSRSFTTPGVRCIELIISFLSFLISILVAATSKNNKHDGDGNTQDYSYDCSCTEVKQIFSKRTRINAKLYLKSQTINKQHA